MLTSSTPFRATWVHRVFHNLIAPRSNPFFPDIFAEYGPKTLPSMHFFGFESGKNHGKKERPAQTTLDLRKGTRSTSIAYRTLPRHLMRTKYMNTHFGMSKTGQPKFFTCLILYVLQRRFSNRGSTPTNCTCDLKTS